MEKEKKQKVDKKEAKPQDIKVYDVLPSLHKKNPKLIEKGLEKLDRSESCL